MAEQATHYIDLKDANGSPLARFWLDPFHFGQGRFLGNAGWDDQCSYCGGSLNEHYTLIRGKTWAECSQCQERYQVHAHGSSAPRVQEMEYGLLPTQCRKRLVDASRATHDGWVHAVKEDGGFYDYVSAQDVKDRLAEGYEVFRCWVE